jgi:hypothetical protein
MVWRELPVETFWRVRGGFPNHLTSTNMTKLALPVLMNKKIKLLLRGVKSPAHSVRQESLLELSANLEQLFFVSKSREGGREPANISEKEAVDIVAELCQMIKVVDEATLPTVFWVLGKAPIAESLAAVSTAMVESQSNLSDESLYQALIAIDNLISCGDPPEVIKRRIGILNQTQSDKVVESATSHRIEKIAELAKRLSKKIGAK